MMGTSCPREIEVVASVLDSGRGRVDDESVSAHLECCEACREVAMVTRLMTSDHDHARQVIRVPAAGQVWWRAAVRARLEAVHAAARPLTWSHGVAGACALGLAVALIGLAWPAVRDAVAWVSTFAFHAAPFHEASTFLGATLRGAVMAMLVAAVCLVIAPVALYFALSDE
jgi:hypothetical protein